MKALSFSAAVISLLFFVTCGGGASKGKGAPDGTGGGKGGTGGVLEMEMIFVEGGTFLMGYTPLPGERNIHEYSEEMPRHSVTLNDFHIGKYEVTQRQWKSIMGKNPSNFRGAQLPVESVSWNEVQTFITKLNAKTGKNYRLPTEAEWEYAARGGQKSAQYRYAGSNEIYDVAWYYVNSGDDILPEDDFSLANMDKNKNRPRAVGTKIPNELGIHDMSGNVWEWTSTWYALYTERPKRNPKGPKSGTSKVIRGGGWNSISWVSRVTLRSGAAPNSRNNSLGFRLVLPAEQAVQSL